MTFYIIRRLLWAIPVLVSIILVTFVLARAIPGGPFDRNGDKKLPESVRINFIIPAVVQSMTLWAKLSQFHFS